MSRWKRARANGRSPARGLWAVAGGFLFLCTGRQPAQEPEEDAAVSAEKLVELIQELEKSTPEPQGVLDGLDLERAPAETKRLARTLRETRIDLVLDKQDLPSVVDLLRQVSGCNFLITPQARAAIEAARPEITLKLRGLTLENALNLLSIHLGDYRFTIRYGAVLLVQKDEYHPVKVLRIYEVTDLVRPLRNFPAPPLALTAPGEKR